MEGILALMIPIVAIVVWSPIGSAIGAAIQNSSSSGNDHEIMLLNDRLQALEYQLSQQTEQVQLLQENSRFYTQLIEQQHTQS